MTLSFAPYTLAPGRNGALIRIKEGSHYGYADLHPIPAWGDPPLEAIISQRSGPLWDRTLYFARLDLEARVKKISLLQGKTIPKSHHLMIEAASYPAVKPNETIKLKVGKNLAEEKKALQRMQREGIHVKLDCGFRFDRNTFLATLLELLPSGLKPLYIEDPYPFEKEQWIEDQLRLQIPFAWDQGSEKGIGESEAAPILILKPARESEVPFYEAIQQGQRVIITSCIDHPLGQAAAAFIAASFPNELAGLLSHEVLPINPYAALLESQERVFIPPEGFGFGFDQVLEKERFVCLN
jgi:hypothetical protein